MHWHAILTTAEPVRSDFHKKDTMPCHSSNSASPASPVPIVQEYCHVQNENQPNPSITLQKSRWCARSSDIPWICLVLAVSMLGFDGEQSLGKSLLDVLALLVGCVAGA
jgi:hypothetical protein